MTISVPHSVVVTLMRPSQPSTIRRAANIVSPEESAAHAGDTRTASCATANVNSAPARDLAESVTGAVGRPSTSSKVAISSPESAQTSSSSSA